MKKLVLAILISATALMLAGCRNTPTSIEPPHISHRAWEFDSLEDFWLEITTGFDEDALHDLEKLEDASRKGSFSRFINSVRSDGVWIPFYQGNAMNLEDYSNGGIAVRLKARGSSGGAEVFYPVNINGHRVGIWTTYIEDGFVVEKTNGYSWYVRKREEEVHENDISEEPLEETEIIVNHTKIPALVRVTKHTSGGVEQFGSETYDHIQFVYENMLVLIPADHAVLENDGLAGLSFERYMGG